MCMTTFVLVSCQNNENQAKNSESINSSSYINENRYDPTLIKIGEKIQTFVLSDIVVIPATDDYPIDTVSALFEGKAILTGDLHYIKADNDLYNEDLLTFTPNYSSQLKLPISHHEETISPIVFVNQAKASLLLDILPGEKRTNVTLEIDQFTDHFLAGDALDTAKLINVIK